MEHEHVQEARRAGATFRPGSAYWNQRFQLARLRDHFNVLWRTVNRSIDLSLYQFAQLFAAALEFAPDLILELGRLTGNSTCAFTEAANQLSAGSPTRVISVCQSRDWDRITARNLRKVVPATWFNPLNAVRADILKFDFSRVLDNAHRVLLFWDAHGFEIAERVLGDILPKLAERDHVVLMHDLSDVRYGAQGLSDYAGKRLWKGGNTGETRFRIGVIDSGVEQAIAVQDFAARNRLTLDSADHSIDLEISQLPGRAQEMRNLLGDELFSTHGHWFWFTLNEHPGPYTFPRFNR